jgi:hypothetical protein
VQIRARVYRPRRPETTALYEVVRDNLETLYGAIDEGAIAVRLPKHARKELEAYLDCGLLCRGFARLRCQDCGFSRLVAFSCKGRGLCPSCLGRRMNATAADLMERVLPPQSGLRQWVLTFPFPWRRRLAQDGALLGRLTRIVTETVLAFYAARAALQGWPGAKSGAVIVVQRRSSQGIPNVPTPIVYRDTLFVLKEGGILTSLNPRTGEVHRRGRLDGAPGEYLASPVASGGRLYLANLEGKGRHGQGHAAVGGRVGRLPGRADLRHSRHLRGPDLHPDAQRFVLLRKGGRARPASLCLGTRRPSPQMAAPTALG